MNSNISLPRGTRDFGPMESERRNFIIHTLEEVFHNYGFLPIHTPAMENLETLTGKYGEEGDQLLFRILNSGLHEQKNKEQIKEKFLQMLERPTHSSVLTDKALRYDLTVPFARYVSMHRQNIPIPFRRYQIQPVWRADRPQKGRYREFYQCDADIIGTSSLISDWELIRLADDAFGALKIPAELRWNHRRILQAIAEQAGCHSRFSEFTLCLDKWDKAGKDGVAEEFSKRNFSDSTTTAIIQSITELEQSDFMQSGQFPSFLKKSESARQAIHDIIHLTSLLKEFPLSYIRIVPDFTLARGLNYYTGFIFEAKATGVDFHPSILGGGRYDNLTGIFGQPGLSGVGISFGLDRIYDVMEHSRLFPPHLSHTHFAFCMALNMGSRSISFLFPILHQLRTLRIPCFQYPDEKKISRQLDYAHKTGITLALIAGEEEMKQNILQVKNLHTKIQSSLSLNEVIPFIQKQYEHFQHPEN